MLRIFLPRAMPPALGSEAPSFTLPDPAGGNEVSLSDFVGQETVIVFLRGTWCPYCRDQLRELAENQARLASSGIAVVAIVCQSVASVKNYLNTNPLPFPLLADAQRNVAKAYGVHYAFSLEGVNLAHPSLFILDRSGSVVFHHVGRSMRDLPVGVVLNRFASLLEPSPERGAPGDVWQGTFIPPSLPMAN